MHDLECGPFTNPGQDYWSVKFIFETSVQNPSAFKKEDNIKIKDDNKYQIK